MSATPTPGPWRVDGEGIRAMVRGADATIVAVRHRHPAATHEANAHLIAAAPEMLEMLHWAQTAADRLVECTPAGVLRTGIRAKADEMRALIARAEGR